MRRFVWAQLRVRAGRTVALGLAILVAATGFTVLTASSSASRLQTVGTVQAHARTTYDLLVRPRGSRTELETSRHLVQPGFLTAPARPGHAGWNCSQPSASTIERTRS